MNLLVKTAIAAALLSASAVASASTVTGTFDFSYSFADGQEVTGSFTGTTTDGGQSVTNVSNFQVSLNGIAFAPVTVGGTTYGSATLQANAWNSSAVNFDDTTPVTIYANASLNNFIISDVDAAVNTSPSYEFLMINDPANSTFQVTAANFLQSDQFNVNEGNPTQLAGEGAAAQSSWTLVAAPVPLPAAVWLFASGLGLFGIRGRRREAV